MYILLLFLLSGRGRSDDLVEYDMQLLKLLQNTPSFVRLPRDLYTGEEPAAEIQDWRGSIRPMADRHAVSMRTVNVRHAMVAAQLTLVRHSQVMDELREYEFGLSDYDSSVKNVTPRGTDKKKEIENKFQSMQNHLIEEHRADAESRSDRRKQETLRRHANVEEIPTIDEINQSKSRQ